MRILSRIKIKALAFCLLITLVLFSFTGCSNPFEFSRFEKYAPHNYPNSVWATENGEISFRVEESETIQHKGTIINQFGDPVYRYTRSCMFGEINKGEETYDIFVQLGYIEVAYMNMMSKDLPEIGELGKYNEELREYELVSCDISNMSDKHFRATVSRSSIYEVGTTFDFYRQE